MRLAFICLIIKLRISKFAIFRNFLKYFGNGVNFRNLALLGNGGLKAFRNEVQVKCRLTSVVC